MPGIGDLTLEQQGHFALFSKREDLLSLFILQETFSYICTKPLDDIIVARF